MPVTEHFDHTVFAGNAIGHEKFVATEGSFEIDVHFDLAGSPNGEDHQLIHPFETLNKSGKVVESTAVFVGLPDDIEGVKVPEIPIGLECVHGRLDLGGVVAVIINNNTRITVLDHIKTLFDPSVVEQAGTNILDRLSEFQSSQNRQSRIERNVFSEAKDFKQTIVPKGKPGMGLSSDQDILNLGNIPGGVETNRFDLQGAEKGIFGIDHPESCQRQKASVGIVEALLIVRIILHMLRLNVGDQCQIGVGVEETLVTLIGFEHHPVVIGMADIGAKLLGDGADEGIGFRQQGGKHR